LSEPQVLVAGSGHLGDRLAWLLRETRPVVRVAPVQPGSLEAFETALETAGIATAAALYIVDDRDAANIQFVLAALKLRPDLEITMAISNERLVPHLQRLHPNLLVVNPWESVAPEIIKALREPASSTIASAAALPLKAQTPFRSWAHDNGVLLWLAAAFVALIAGATAFFHRSERLDWITSFYFVVTMGTTTGFGDISLRDSSAVAKMVGMLMMLSGIGFVSVFFSLLLDRIVARRTELLLGHRRHALNGHVVVCGLGRLGYHLVQKLRTEAYPVLVIEKDAENRFLPAAREIGIPVIIADATLPKTLVDAAVDRASAVTSLFNDDLLNLEVGLNARAIHPHIRVILRIFDRDTAEELRSRIHIHYAISTSTIAARAMLDRTGREAPQSR
jgi:Trk K+ transport system NAD-binding subunit